MQVSGGPVIIKGVREGLLFLLDDDVPYPQVLTELSQRINSHPDFFKGASVIVNAGSRVLERPDFDVLYKMLTRHEMKVSQLVSLSAQSRMVAESYGVTARPPSFAAAEAGMSLGLKGRGTRADLSEIASAKRAPEPGSGLFLRTNLRSGQSVRYGGDVCILGDVETGAEVIADGDVVVWGALSGTVHAGASGDKDSVVCALCLSPAQLSVAGVSARFPSITLRYPDAPPPPEMACLEEGQIAVQAWTIEKEASVVEEPGPQDLSA